MRKKSVPPDGYYTTRMAADAAGCSRERVTYAVMDGQFPGALRIDGIGRWYIPIKELNAWVKNGKNRDRNMMSKTDEAILEFICTYKRQYDGNSPSIRQIGAGIGISSSSQIDYHLKRLERFGHIKRRSMISRSIEMVNGQWTYSGSDTHDEHE